MRAEVICQVRLFLREWAMSGRLGKRWAKQTINHAPKTYNQLMDQVMSENDFYQKIVQPGLKTAEKFIRSGYVNAAGLSKQTILNRRKKRLSELSSQYFINLKEGFQTIKNNVKNGQSKYAKSTAKYLLPFTGRRGIGKGLGPLAAGWLTGDTKIKRFLARTDKIIKGEPVLITAPEKAGRFRKALINQIIHSGTVIMRAMDMSEYVKELLHKGLHVDSELTNILEDTLIDENKAINNLVNSYQQKIFKPFKPGGNSPRLGSRHRGVGTVASHIDFFVEEIFNESKWQWETKLGLEIQVAR